PNANADTIEEAERPSGASTNHQHRQRDDEEKRALQEVHLRIRAGIKPLAPFPSPGHVAEIFRFAAMAGMNVPCQTYAPYAHQNTCQESSRSGTTSQKERCP